MTAKELIKDIEGVFKLPVKKTYFGKIKYYTPYFEPRGFCNSIIKVRKLIPLSEEELAKNAEKGYGWAKKKYSNMPMARRSKNWTISLFGNDYYIRVGTPFKIARVHLGWKDKWHSPRFEWGPSFQFWMFNWQYAVTWSAPKVKNHINKDIVWQDDYWEQVLRYLHYSDKDIRVAEETWGWTTKTEEGDKVSTWNKNYLI